jgi:UDP-N-acetylglucosamine:LPS N-acetylglucosamine transferase
MNQCHQTILPVMLLLVMLAGCAKQENEKLQTVASTPIETLSRTRVESEPLPIHSLEAPVTQTAVESSVEPTQPGKQRILIFTDPGGGGHMAASRAAKDILNDKYEIRVITPLMQLPLISSYNVNQRKGNVLTLRLLTKLQPLGEFLVTHFSIRKLITSELLAYKPDLIISVIPLVNRLTQDILVSHKLNTPLLVLTTDLEARHFFLGVSYPGPLVKVSLPFDDETLRKPLRGILADENFISLGFPLRPEFGISSEERQPKIEAIREELGIQESDKTVVIMMGAQGAGKAITKYSKKIARSSMGSENQKIHIVALCGKNEKLKFKTEATANPKNPNVVIHALGVKEGDYVAALMHFADVLVSKPGGASTNEAFASELYTLYHTDKSPFGKEILLPWEEGNMNYSVQKNWGERIKKKEFINQLQSALSKPRLKIETCEGRNFKKNLLDYVETLLPTQK